MIEVICDKGIEKLNISGKTDEIIADTFCIIRAIYSAIDGVNKDVAKLYSEVIAKDIKRAFKSDDEIAKEALEALKHLAVNSGSGDAA